MYASSDVMFVVKLKEFINSEKVIFKSEPTRSYCEQNDITSYRLFVGDEMHVMDVI